MGMATPPQDGVESLIEITPAHDDDIAKLIAERRIEGPHLRIFGADVEIDGPNAPLFQPGLGGPHRRLPQASMLDSRCHRNIIEPAAMAVVTDHDRGDELILQGTD